MHDATTTSHPFRPSIRYLLPFLALSILGLVFLLAGCQGKGAEETGGVPTMAAAAPLPSITAGLEGADTTRPAPEAEETPLTPAAARAESVQPSSSPEAASEDPYPGATSASVEPSPGNETAPAGDRSARPLPAGALIAVTMDGQAGVLLDELPGEMRDRVAEALIERPDPFWMELARRQVRLTQRRLNFRNFVYEVKGQLPLPPEALWTISLDRDGPQRRTMGSRFDEHDVVTIDYEFSSTLLTDADSPAAAEPELAEVGGEWKEPFVLPIDPDLLLQRTDNACLNEAGFPPNSFDSENAWIFFDYTCEANSIGILGCHRSFRPSQSCLEALTDSVGTIDTEVSFERLAWDPDLADEVRIGDLTHRENADLKVVGSELENNRIIYRYFPADSCALAEQCVGGSGWRRLLQFDATVHNVGGAPLDIGPVVAEDPAHNLFQYNSCHNHFHFNDYGDFYLTDAEQELTSKQAFCVESTDRFSNNEFAPLIHAYSCRIQGVQSGWVDEYDAGLDCQWIDITDIDIPAEGSTVSLGFSSNPDQFLCEGTPVLDDDGSPLWEPSGLTDPDGESIERPQCDFVPDWDANNNQSREVFLPTFGSFVTEPCLGGQIGPLRNCGFSQQLASVQPPSGQRDPRQPEIETPDGAFTCRPGRPVQLSCSLEEAAAPQVLRVCEHSQLLGVGVACTHLDSLANVIVGPVGSEVGFTCPVARDEDEPGGIYSLYSAPVFDEDEPADISCSAGD